jgi:chromosomal replication initiator protein
MDWNVESTTAIWEQFLNIIREEAGSRVVETWFKAVSLQNWDSVHQIAYVEAPNAFVTEWLQGNYMSLMQLHLGRLLNVKTPKIILNNAREKIKSGQLVNDEGHNAQETTIIPAIYASPSSSRNALALKSKVCGHINKNYSFDTFIVGPNNSLAHAAAYAITERPGSLYNPLFIYGGSGLGKTHLLHAIGNRIKEQYKKFIILYQTTDRFVNEFINAIRFDKMHAFQAKYRNIDVLLIDDVQFISDKEQTQEAFFHIFNAMYEAQKQIVLSSDSFPQDINGLAERLRSRLGWGLVTDIHIPSLETKIAILKKKAEQSETSLDDDVAHFIASHVESNIRELEGAFIRVTAFSMLTKQPVNMELAQKVLIRSHVRENNVSFNCIANVVCNKYPYTVDALRSKSRNKELSFARHIAMFLMKQLTDKSLRDIGIFFKRDHATVLHGLDKIHRYIENHPAFQHTLQDLEREILG